MMRGSFSAVFSSALAVGRVIAFRAFVSVGVKNDFERI